MEFIRHLTFADLIDMAVIAIFIYFILIWFKRARARFMLVGMITVGLIYLLARAFELYLTTAVFQAFFAIFLVIIVVIFQDDFRYFFEKMATWGIVRKRRGSKFFNKNVEILTSAIANLSRQKIGALIVVRGKDILDRYLETGVALDGLVSQPLIEAIFDPNTPTHDGAVIIDGNRITRFGCHLPLSTNIGEIGRLGTRHAAALGLAERTDALCIALSEQQQTISVAEGTKIKQLTNLEHLGLVMENFYRQKFPENRKSAVIDFLTGHYLEKVIAIILACGIWFVFGHRIETIRRDFVVPIEYRNLAPDRMIGEPKPKEVSVTLTGPERIFNSIDPKELMLSFDMSQVKDGKGDLALTKEMVKVPAGLSVVHIEPDSMALVIDRMITVNVPVHVNTKGELGPRLAIKDIRAEPKEVSVVVADTFPRDKVVVATDTIDMKSITEDAALLPKLTMPPEVRFAGGKAPDVKVLIDVEKKNGK